MTKAKASLSSPVTQIPQRRLQAATLFLQKYPTLVKNSLSLFLIEPNLKSVGRKS